MVICGIYKFLFSLILLPLLLLFSFFYIAVILNVFHLVFVFPVVVFCVDALFYFTLIYIRIKYPLYVMSDKLLRFVITVGEFPIPMASGEALLNYATWDV